MQLCNRPAGQPATSMVRTPAVYAPACLALIYLRAYMAGILTAAASKRNKQRNMHHILQCVLYVPTSTTVRHCHGRQSVRQCQDDDPSQSLCMLCNSLIISDHTFRCNGWLGGRIDIATGSDGSVISRAYLYI